MDRATVIWILVGYVYWNSVYRFSKYATNFQAKS